VSNFQNLSKRRAEIIAKPRPKDTNSVEFEEWVLAQCLALGMARFMARLGNREAVRFLADQAQKNADMVSFIEQNPIEVDVATASYDYSPGNHMLFVFLILSALEFETNCKDENKKMEWRLVHEANRRALLLQTIGLDAHEQVENMLSYHYDAVAKLLPEGDPSVEFLQTVLAAPHFPT